MGESRRGNAGRRTVLKLLAGSVAGLSALRARSVVAAEPIMRAADTAIAIEFDAALRSRVLMRQEMRQGGALVPLTDYEPSESLRLAGGRRVDDFEFQHERHDRSEDMHGPGTRHTVRGLGDGIEKELSILLYDRFPGFALVSVLYRNVVPSRSASKAG